MDIEGAGGAITGGLIAGAVEKPTGHAGEAGHGVCSDCGAATSGNFCANCGQATHVHRTLLHLGEELLHGVMHFDARVWRTLPLLAFNPGRLTREWVEGRRTRYVSPLAIFLFTLFVMFFALSFMPQPSAPVVLAGDIQAQRQELLEAERGLAEARAEAASDPSGMADMGIKAGEALVAQKRAALARLETEQSQGRADGLKPGSWQASIKDIASGEDVSGGTTKLKVMGHEADKDDHGFGATVLKKLQNPDLALYKLQQTMYKFAFLLVPFSIPFLALLFLWRRGFTLYDHGVFVLYSLTFMALLLMVIVLARTINGPLGGLVTAIGVAAIPVHVFAQLKGAYSLSIFSALWRTVLLLFFCNIVIGLFVMAIVYLGLGH
ncbi:MAG: hypothetical protein DCF29_25320 [Alphaproteobacteria bacterium]|uniref:DUF3667 domain-containing protein n=1 Tax=Brevundimonas sp. TaxID=1871086 RepID=UPI000DAFAA97|nr:DUF3667 domain-containing protein [Brevundimonas sp.]MBJ7319600.1 DUF3667 domain-containing protein [Brevundimonas sp.]PZN94672.1 MAG: hypothetical protein DCF29_25320 [Alphaproteobacteria bacterium]